MVCIWTISTLIMIGITASQFDTDALSYLSPTRANITNSLERLGINYLVSILKLNNLWTKIIAAYPFVGSTQSSCLRNLKEDTNNLIFFNTVAGDFTSNGWLPNGTNSYADTNITFNTETSLNSLAMGFYSRTNNISLGIDMGGSAINTNSISLSGGITMSTTSNNATGLVSSISSTQGLFVVSRTASNAVANYRNGVSLNTSTNTSIALPPVNCFLGARQFGNGGPASNFSNRQFAFAFISSGLTAGEVSTLYTIIQNFQTILQRAV
jgi:hypothetical protein